MRIEFGISLYGRLFKTERGIPERTGRQENLRKQSIYQFRRGASIDAADVLTATS